MNELREKITDFIFMQGEAEECDAVFCAGTSYPSIPEYAAELYKGGYAPLIFVGGRYSITKGRFCGVKEKADVYTGDYLTESEFYRDVLAKNGVPESAILWEDRSTYTKENAVYARELADEKGVTVGRAILLCHSFHARRAYMYYKLQFPDTEIIPIGLPFHGVTRENWYQSEIGLTRVMGEMRRIGEQFSLSELDDLFK
ncbi:MAG: YdcF family protein [Clostridia bacterium]|nr:YdcF family protein [Clostridia bacterium]